MSLWMGVVLGLASTSFGWVEDKPRIVFVIAEDEYNAADTLPQFAREELADDFDCAFLISHDKHSIPGLETLRDADLVVLYVRRRELPEEQLTHLRDYLDQKKPLVALRTSSHAFESWKTFDEDILGCHYDNHHGNKSEENPTYIQVVAEQAGHPVLAGLPSEEFTVPSWLYKSRPLADTCVCLMTGRVGDRPVEPVAWTNTADRRRVFYTMLGHPKDFELPAFRRMLVSAIRWGLGLPSSSWMSLQTTDREGPLGGTRLLETDVDIASELVAGVDRFCNRQLEEQIQATAPRWNLDGSSLDAFFASLKPHRQRLANMLGIDPDRPQCNGFELVATTKESALVQETDKYAVYSIRWPVVRGVYGEGLLLEPRQRDRIPAAAILLPHPSASSEQIAGVTRDRWQDEATRLAEAGMRVVIPVLIDRATEFSVTAKGTIQTNLTHREFLYRPGFELGRHLIGYEVMKVSAAIEALRAEAPSRDGRLPVGLIGTGDGGQIAFFTAALRGDVDVAYAGDASGTGQKLHEQPLDRNLFGVLRDFGDDGLILLALPGMVRFGSLSGIDSFEIAPGGRGGPSRPRVSTDPWPSLLRLAASAVPADLRSKACPLDLALDYESLVGSDALRLARDHNVATFAARLGVKVKTADGDDDRPRNGFISASSEHNARMKRQVQQVEADLQGLLEESPYTRATYWANTQEARKNRSVEEWVAATKPYRQTFRDEVIGHFDLPKLPPRPRSRLYVDDPKYVGYEVVLDVFEDVIAYGILLVPKDLKDGQRRPVVVCQHGLEGRPSDLADPRIHNPAYNQYGCRLAERGFVVFAPQNLYIFRDRFRVLQRKLNPLGRTLFSIIVPQHEQIVDWLATLPFVDSDRIAFYGLSYGGKSAMRIPALVETYCLSICSADFNDWVWKNASTRSPYSYVNTAEYEIFEWDLGSRFNYAEMAGLICPRPFMVERGHYDGVAPDDRVASEYAKVRLLYNDLGIAHRTAIEFFDGPHTIHGVGTFRFLHEQLDWPSPADPVPLNR